MSHLILRTYICTHKHTNMYPFFSFPSLSLSLFSLYLSALDLSLIRSYLLSNWLPRSGYMYICHSLFANQILYGLILFCCFGYIYQRVFFTSPSLISMAQGFASSVFQFCFVPIKQKRVKFRNFFTSHLIIPSHFEQFVKFLLSYVCIYICIVYA